MPYTFEEDGYLHSVSIYHNGGSGDMLLAVYSDDSGYPDDRLAVSEETAVNSTAGWQTIELTELVKVEEGQTVWLAWVFENMPGVRAFDDSPNGGGRASSGQDWSYGMPTDFGTSTLSSYKYAICANYIAADEEPQVTLIGNPYMYTGRRYDIETGLYYYRARYYNPYIGRFLQVDPVRDGMNWYAYCGNNSINCIDPTGCSGVTWNFVGVTSGANAGKAFGFSIGELTCGEFKTISEWVDWMTMFTKWLGFLGGGSEWAIAHIYECNEIDEVPGWKLSCGRERLFWYLMAINKLLSYHQFIPPAHQSIVPGPQFDYLTMSEKGYHFTGLEYEEIGMMEGEPGVPCGVAVYPDKSIFWNENIRWNVPRNGFDWANGYSDPESWFNCSFGVEILILAHELQHVADVMSGCGENVTNPRTRNTHLYDTERLAGRTQNIIYYRLALLMPTSYKPIQMWRSKMTVDFMDITFPPISIFELFSPDWITPRSH